MVGNEHKGLLYFEKVDSILINKNLFFQRSAGHMRILFIIMRKEKI